MAEEYTSKSFNVLVKSLPQLKNFEIFVDVPDYTQLEDFTVTNTADITFPAGSKLSWKLQSVDADSMYFIRKIDSSSTAFEFIDNAFQLQQNISKSQSFILSGSNQFFNKHSIIEYAYTFIPDVYPTIKTVSQTDSSNMFKLYFRGLISDDYGFTNLNFVWYPQNNIYSLKSSNIDFTTNQIAQEFYFMNEFEGLQQGDSIVYYFEVYDNDAIFGPKRSTTQKEYFKIP